MQLKLCFCNVSYEVESNWWFLVWFFGGFLVLVLSGVFTRCQVRRIHGRIVTVRSVRSVYTLKQLTVDRTRSPRANSATDQLHRSRLGLSACNGLLPPPCRAGAQGQVMGQAHEFAIRVNRVAVGEGVPRCHKT